MRTKHYLLLLLAMLPVLTLRDFTPDNELRYLSIVDEALKNGHFFTFTNQGLPYADKPPFYLWLLMLGKWMLGGHYMWFLSLFSILPAFGIVAVMDKWVKRESNIDDRLTGGLMMMSCGLFLGAAVVIRMDMLMTYFIVLSLYTFYKMVKGVGNECRNSWLFPLYMFMALFTKGPVGILVPLLSTLVFLLTTGRLKNVGRYWGWKTWLVLLLGCGIWFGGVYWEGGPEYLNNLLFHQTVDRAVNSFHHEAPFYYYLISVWYSLAPWSLFLVAVILTGFFCGYVRSDLERFFLTILFTTLVMLSCISSKIAIYLVPAFPFFVYLAVLLMARFRWNPWWALTITIPAVVFLVAPFALIFIHHIDANLGYLQHPLIYVATGLLSLGALVSLIFLYGQKQLNMAVNILALSLFCTIFVSGWALPSLNKNLGFAPLCEKAQEISKLKELSGYSTLYISRPESMDVFLHEDVNIMTPEDVMAGKCAGTVLMVNARKAERNKELAKFLEEKHVYKFGPYWLVTF